MTRRRRRSFSRIVFEEEKGCRSLRQGDEYACPCGLRWAADEDRPPCPMRSEATMPEVVEHELRKSFPILVTHVGWRRIDPGVYVADVSQVEAEKLLAEYRDAFNTIPDFYDAQLGEPYDPERYRK